jgi:hypothetical protein
VLLDGSEMSGSLPGTRHLSPHGSASAAKAKSSAENGKKGGRPLGRSTERPGRSLAIEAAPRVCAELIRLALHGKVETVRAAACRDVLAYAWGRPAAFDGDEELRQLREMMRESASGGQVLIVNVVTGVRG